MLKFFKWFVGLFSPYVNRFERKVDKFFKSIKSSDNIGTVRVRLLSLMKENLVIVNVWMEKKYKGYRYLRKSVRRKMYDDVSRIVAKFNKEISSDSVSDEMLGRLIKPILPKFEYKNNIRLQYLYEIMRFLRPGKYYEYISTASFGKLLCDPDFCKMQGDCNQIVTLYIYLYGLRFPLDELNIKIVPGHVCLHFNGLDIECTNATFQNYTSFEKILPVTEILSTNLLDLTDFREEVQIITPRTILKSAQLAYAISSFREIVSRNLQTSYNNLAISFLKSKNFASAIFYFEKLGDPEKLKNAYRSAAIFYMSASNFGKAKFFVEKSGDADLAKQIRYNEGVYYYKRKNIDKALRIFVELNEDKMIKACYGVKYHRLLKRVKNDKTLQDQKKHKATYRSMYDLALKMGNQNLVDSLRRLLNSL